MGANDWEMEAHPRHEWRNRRPTADQMQGSRHLPTAVTWLFCGPRRRRRPFYLGRFHFPSCPSGRPLLIDTLAVHGVFPFLQPTRHLTQALVLGRATTVRTIPNPSVPACLFRINRFASSRFLCHLVRSPTRPAGTCVASVLAVRRFLGIGIQRTQDDQVT